MQFGDEELTGTTKDYDAVHAWDIYEGPKSPPKPIFASPKKKPGKGGAPAATAATAAHQAAHSRGKGNAA